MVADRAQKELKKYENHFQENISSILEEFFSNKKNVALINIISREHSKFKS